MGELLRPRVGHQIKDWAKQVTMSTVKASYWWSERDSDVFPHNNNNNNICIYVAIVEVQSVLQPISINKRSTMLIGHKNPKQT